MRQVALAVIAVMLPVATPAAAWTRIVTITSAPVSALVTVVGFGECETPCTVAIDQPRQIVVAKAGYLPQRLTIQTRQRRVHVVLELAAPTQDVDSEALPELK